MTREHPTVGVDLPSRVAPAREAADDDRARIEEFFRRYAPYVAKIGYRLLGRPDEVDDLVQDVFLAAHRGVRSIREPEAIRGWLATVAVRTAKRRLRARKLRAVVGLDGEHLYAEVASNEASPEQQAILSAVYRVLDGLPVNQRLAWTLRHIEGERLERVAEMCQCSLATVKRRIKAANDAIQKGVDHG